MRSSAAPDQNRLPTCVYYDEFSSVLGGNSEVLTGELDPFSAVSPRHIWLRFAADFAPDQRVRVDGWVLWCFPIIERDVLCNSTSQSLQH